MAMRKAGAERGRDRERGSRETERQRKKKEDIVIAEFKEMEQLE